jgi:ring-1,2-phenylacetyl-CoA epoxidase subunit PaaE
MPLTPPAAAPPGPPRFHPLAIAEIRRESADAVSVRFALPDGLRAAYAYRAGQYLTLRAVLDGEEVRRTYSICAGEDEAELRIAIKRTEGGYFSVWAQDHLHPGRVIDVMTPTGRFGIPPAAQPGAARLHVGIAGGSGITPLLSVIRTVLAREPASRFLLLYASRASGQILFRAELEDLKDRHLGRLAVQHILSREQQDIAVLGGRLDAARIRHLLAGLLAGAPVDAAYVCGPAGLLEQAEAALAALGVPAARIHVERFTSAEQGSPRAAAAPPPPPGAPAVAHAGITIHGIRSEVPIAAGEAVLDAALRAGLDLPYACKGGMCCTCRARLVSGEVEMLQNYSLEPWERDAGFVLTCQSHPRSARLELDYDQQ